MEHDVMYAFLPLLIGGGLSLASLIGGALSGDKGKSTEEGEKLRQMLLGEIETARGRSSAGPSEARQGFDANKTAREAIGAYSRLALPGIHDAIQDITGGAVGGGRLSTGFLGEDLERFTRKATDRGFDVATSRGLEGSAQNLRNIEGGERTDLLNRGLFYDLLTGTLDREQERKDRGRSNFWQTLGGIGGSFLGLGGFNPFRAGGSTGYQMGQGV
jgi:hypothetical protein